MALFPSAPGGVQIEVLPRWPGKIVATGGIKATATGGTVTIESDIPSLVEVTPADNEGRFVHVWNEAADTNERVELVNLPTHSQSWNELTDKPAEFPPEAHTHPSTDISDSTPVGRAVLTAASATAARSAIGAAAASHTHPASQISDSTSVGRALVTALDAAAARSAIAAAAENHTHTASQVMDFSEAVDDRVAALLQPGRGIALTYDDGSNTLTVTNTATIPSTDTGNRLINGDFRICQRGTGTAADNTYGFDRWYILSESGGIAYSQPAGGGGKFMNTTGSVQKLGVAQVIESANLQDLASQAVTLSGRISGLDGTNRLNWAILSGATGDFISDWWLPNQGVIFGSGVTVIAQGPIEEDPFSKTAILPPSLGNITVFLWVDVPSTPFTQFTLSKIKMERGSTATEFAQRPYGQELALCYRYYQTLSVVVDTPSAFGTLALPIQMRTTPAIAGGGPGFTAVTNDGKVLNAHQTTRAIQNLVLNAEL
ncbi:hypothetical protein [Microvirga sp. TS319]|uniref:hypothetical protein n=1 Tax=Microvirga sp. TS319 TaxID=3241165 RepID=UPI00351A57E2